MNKFLVLLFIATIMACNSNADSKKIAKKSAPAKVEVAGIKHITKADYLKLVYNYEKNPKQFVYEGDLPVIVDFYADWCGPCKRVAPILEKMAVKYAGKIRIYKVDVDAEKDLAAAHGIQSIPTMFFYPKKGEPQVVKGALPEESIEKAINDILLPSGGK